MWAARSGAVSSASSRRGASETSTPSGRKAMPSTAVHRGALGATGRVLSIGAVCESAPGESRLWAVPYALDEKFLRGGLGLLALARRGSALAWWDAAVARRAATGAPAVARPVAAAPSRRGNRRRWK